MGREIKDEFTLGNIGDGINNKLGFTKIRDATGWAVSDEECRACSIQSACAYCIAGCYDEYGEFKRTKHLCGVTKLTSKWVKKYWDTIDGIENIKE